MIDIDLLFKSTKYDVIYVLCDVMRLKLMCLVWN